MHYRSRQTLKHTIALNLRRLKFGPPRPRVFCVGFQKTGTTSLQYALSRLGYRVGGVFPVKDLDRREQMFERAMELLPQFDAFADNPWCLYYKEFDEAFPGSKFILTTRDPEKWYNSACRHFGDRWSQMHEWIYGVPVPIGNKDAWIGRLLSHQEEVRDHFADRPQDFIEFDVSRGDGWTELCRLLDKKIPSSPFPQLNTARMRS
ncbi:sulfotransferase family protein [uncultured Mameliella sp.]|uniref:sulfotransferase family protein n=1 Tax=uncultured Mameliella sp. TaxID=1447087 RepID=UPI0026281B37|nr:sulfotransferase family protein [uncultured Mameliella sp.]